jgi:hypothetical protein
VLPRDLFNKYASDNFWLDPERNPNAVRVL